MQENFTFEGQRPREEVVFVIKRHPWVLAPAGFISIAVLVALVLAILIFAMSFYTSIVIGAVVVFFSFTVFTNGLYSIMIIRSLVKIYK